MPKEIDIDDSCDNCPEISKKEQEVRAKDKEIQELKDKIKEFEELYLKDDEEIIKQIGKLQKENEELINYILKLSKKRDDDEYWFEVLRLIDHSYGNKKHLSK